MEKLTTIEKKLYECIPSGAEHATSQARLAYLCNISKRQVAKIVKSLRTKGYLIGSSREYLNGSGYYRIDNEEEFYQSIGMLTNTRNEMTRTIHAMTETFTKKGGVKIGN